MSQDLEFADLDQAIKNLARDLGLESATAVQREAIPVILSGSDALVIAPTGSGKTEAALLPIFEKILRDRKSGGIRALYVTPLRALNRDMRLRIEYWGSKLGISVEVRHGDTPQSERRRQALHPPEILITTPETMQLLLVGSRLRQGLQNCEWVVVDEIHQLASNRRGAQLSIALERLQRLVGTGRRIQRIGLSATIGNKEIIGNFLSGSNGPPKIVDASSIAKDVQYKVEMIEPTEADEKVASEIFTSPQTAARLARAADLIRGHDGTLIFVNSRTVAELLGARLSNFGVKTAVHHGSLPREERERVELEFKAGKIQALICTSTLELGIDIGSVDLVIQYMSPRQVNSLIQRVGRSGHSLKRTSEGITLAVSPEDSLESIVISKEALRRHLEPVLIQECALDVLCHQVAGILLEGGGPDLVAVHDLVRSSYAYRNLPINDLKSIVKYMQVLGYLRHDEPNQISIRSGKCRKYYYENVSMIPDERRYNVIDVTNQSKVGILGEEFMMLHAKEGLHFVIKGRVWEIASIQAENVYVTPVKDPLAAIPGWDGELMPIPQNVSEAVGFERGLVEQEVSAKDPATSRSWNADRNAREKILEELKSQTLDHAMPTDKRIVVEKAGYYAIIHTSAGDRVNLTLGEYFEEILLRKGLVRYWWQDGYRILFELTSDEFSVEELSRMLLDYNEHTAGLLKAVIRKHFPFGYYLKFIAERFGALKRGMMLSEDSLRDLVTKFRFTPVYEETLREALLEKVDEENSLDLLRKCKSGEIEVRAISCENGASPLGKYILNRYGEQAGDPESMLTSVESIKTAVSKEVISLLCFKCGELYEFVKVGSLPDEPKCEKCNSSLLSPIFYGAKFAQSSLKKRIEGKTSLSEQEADILTKSRRAADLVLSYGKAGIIAQCVYGVGPQTASKVLSKMEANEEKFYQNLIDAKLNFLRTRQYWD